MADQTVKELARPFPARYVQQNPSGGGRYVTHSVVTQRLIEVLGCPPDFTLEEVLRGDVAAIEPNPNGNSQRAKKGAPALTNVVVGAVCRMVVTVGLADDHGWVRPVTVEEAGDCEDPHNWPHDGARLKDAMSDAYKRCAMRLGCGLHLWSKDQGDYFLFDHLNVEAGSSGGHTGGGVTSPTAEAAKLTPGMEPPPASAIVETHAELSTVPDESGVPLSPLSSGTHSPHAYAGNGQDPCTVCHWALEHKVHGAAA